MTLSADTIVYVVGGIFGGSLAGVVWFVRLEGKVKSLERENQLLSDTVKAVQTSHNDLALKLSEQLGSIKEALARIEGRMGDGRT